MTGLGEVVGSQIRMRYPTPQECAQGNEEVYHEKYDQSDSPWRQEKKNKKTVKRGFGAEGAAKRGVLYYYEKSVCGSWPRRCTRDDPRAAHWFETPPGVNIDHICRPKDAFGCPLATFNPANRARRRRCPVNTDHFMNSLARVSGVSHSGARAAPELSDRLVGGFLTSRAGCLDRNHL